jgi:hypothetical protein
MKNETFENMSHRFNHTLIHYSYKRFYRHFWLPDLPLTIHIVTVLCYIKVRLIHVITWLPKNKGI